MYIHKHIAVGVSYIRSWYMALRDLDLLLLSDDENPVIEVILWNDMADASEMLHFLAPWGTKR
jgi:hypothetical protein